MNIGERIRNCQLCHGLDEQELAAVGRIVRIKNVARGGTLFLEGDRATGFFVLLNGRMKVYKSSAEGKEHTLHVIAPGQMFAEVAIFHGDHFPASCLAEQDSTVAFFPKEAFLIFIGAHPQICLKIIGSLARFVREFNQMIADLSLKEVPARLASYLLARADENHSNRVELEATKSKLAARLGTISETLSRNFRKMMEQEIIRVENRAITIINREALVEIAEGGKIQLEKLVQRRDAGSKEKKSNR